MNKHIRYNRSEKGKARSISYNQSEKGKARSISYNQSEKGEARSRRFHNINALDRLMKQQLRYHQTRLAKLTEPKETLDG